MTAARAIMLRGRHIQAKGMMFVKCTYFEYLDLWVSFFNLTEKGKRRCYLYIEQITSSLKERGSIKMHPRATILPQSSQSYHMNEFIPYLSELS